MRCEFQPRSLGQVGGVTNRRGEFPTDAPVTRQDLLATIYRHLGIGPGQPLTDSLGRPVPILAHGEPIRQLL